MNGTLSLRILLACSVLIVGPALGLAQEPESAPQNQIDTSKAGNAQVEQVMRTFAPRGVQSDQSSPTPASEFRESFQMKAGYDIDLMASEPEISQPLFMSWDSRGRMWVVQYRQYQFPAGLKIVRYDHHLRAVFDKTPAPPPNHVPGADRITVFEDTDGDGHFDHHKDVIDGLNIATSVVVGRGGIWVLNPPYLLFYPDADRDDVPDSDPEVHLSGFGLQDTHSVANSLTWGPDGWLYGANGSTTGGTVSSANTAGITFQGQCIWRYHPGTQEFEIWAEGGGNTFSLEIDSKGHVFCGHNGGNTRGWFLPQGSYSRKNWGKHGPLTNPFAFGFFEAMRFEGDGRRFPQAFLIYEGGLFPKQDFDRTVVAPNAMQNLVWHSQLLHDGSTFRTVDNENLLASSDRWFRPVFADVGPDGAIYIADWYDTRLSHVSPIDDWHKESGRIYRVRPQNSAPAYRLGDLHTTADENLVALLNHPNKWIRQRSVLELGWRPDAAEETISRLIEMVAHEQSLEALWVLNLQHAIDADLASTFLASDSADIRRWTVRILGDRRTSVPELPTLAAHETEIQVRSQLAATARRLDAGVGLAIVQHLLEHDQDLQDLQMPLMCWWALESHADQWDQVEVFLKNPMVWNTSLFRQQLLGRLMQRYASTGRQSDLAHCERLIELAPDDQCREILIQGLNKAYQGRQLPPLPPQLDSALKSYQRQRGESGTVLAVLSGDQEALPQALALLQDTSQDLGLRIEIVRAFGQVRYPPAQPVLVRLATTSGEPALQRVALQSVGIFSDVEIARAVAARFDNSISAEHDLRDTACRTLASREEWAMVLLEQVLSWRLAASEVPADVIQMLRTYEAEPVVAAVHKAFGKPAEIGSPQKTEEILRLTTLLESEIGNPEQGQRLFQQRCGNCHRLFGLGQDVAPPLDSYDRQSLKFWLPAIVAPSIEIREGFQSYLVLTTEDRVITGMIAAQDLKTVTLRSADNQLHIIPRDEIEQLRALPTSLMPDNILGELNDQQIRDLFAYLMSNP